MPSLLLNTLNLKKVYGGMAFLNGPGLLSKTSTPFGLQSKPFNFPSLKTRNCDVKPLTIQARGNSKTESAKITNRRLQKKYNGTPTRPRLSVFCSDKQLYAMLVDDQNKKCLFYGSTLQKSMRPSPSCTTIEAAQHVGEELVKACEDLNIHEISSYDRNGFARGEKMQAFEIAISRYGLLQR
ncbi:50S ribosomal protein L18 isoform X2 [Benincasa hispida]|nr:50S ribosomal protein L18 isoform X2 [Benincasa hispida]